ncbi:fasciclin domain-containing protein [Alkalibacter saccharofermentans]|uniref:Uncaracterized surface protein containing fasciclin (FAS1) repeats n=1 Tax=Alkalibacter saccharofermentans DSM 14828 TaxID=1120975 RepID=A0A1M4Z2S9_9FIRM|nr:fasciclin domain-containing protein [Alkalibacter saccharofermentans]SHF12042.1 Uncaracterized surface protein containing fasciclin (FAS1) repeats [Alkalibacter saccharofermentans DSM 14828]
MKRKVIAVLMILLLVAFSSTAFAADETIVEIAAGNEDFSTLVAALQKAELVDTLSGEGPFTVFAPTNDAFAKLLNELGIEAEDLLNHPQLSDVLLYHVVSGSVMSTDLEEGMTPETLLGETIEVSLTDGVKINDSTVTTADVEATNGVIHIIDTVLVPDSFVLEVEEDAEEDAEEETTVPQTGDIGALPYLLTAALGATGIVAFRKKSKK